MYYREPTPPKLGHHATVAARPSASWPTGAPEHPLSCLRRLRQGYDRGCSRRTSQEKDRRHAEQSMVVAVMSSGSAVRPPRPRANSAQRPDPRHPGAEIHQRGDFRLDAEVPTCARPSAIGRCAPSRRDPDRTPGGSCPSTARASRTSDAMTTWLRVPYSPRPARLRSSVWHRCYRPAADRRPLIRRLR